MCNRRRNKLKNFDTIERSVGSIIGRWSDLINQEKDMRQLKITKSITNRESASLDKYLQEIGREELISVTEEVELAQRIK